jgi:catechol 2,3-dioxygenase-like lactoylglutathione lyase family enzyme
MPSPLEFSCLDHVLVPVRDLKKSEAWYQKTLGFERRYLKEWGPDWHVLGCGKSWIVLSESGQFSQHHFAFQIPLAGYPAARQTLEAHGLEVSEEDHGVSRSLYFHDLDGHRLEITAYR